MDGDVLLPQGAEVRGHVVSALRSGRTKGRARLVVSFDEVRVDGRGYKIQATGFDVTAGSSKGKDAKIAGGAAGGRRPDRRDRRRRLGRGQGRPDRRRRGRRGRARHARRRGRAREPARATRSSSRRACTCAEPRVEARERPARVTRDERVVVPRQLLEQRAVRRSPAFAIATATLRSRPRRFARFTGLRRKRSRKPSSSRPASSARSGARAPGRGSNAAPPRLPAPAVPGAHVLADVAAEDVAARCASRSGSGIAPLSSIVR